MRKETQALDTTPAYYLMNSGGAALASQSRRAIVVGTRRIADAAAKVNGSVVFFEKKGALLKLIA